MKVEIKEVNNENVWEDFLLRSNEKSFLQSWNWGEFQKMMGGRVWRFGVFADNDLVGAALVIKVSARRGKFLLVPHGPIVKISKQDVLNVLLEELKKIAKQEKCGFIRIVPIWERNKENEKIFKDLSFRTAPIHTHPELTWELNLKLSEEELLMNMRKTTRYLIRQGLGNKELTILKSQNVKDVEAFNELYQKTVVRHHFVPFSPNYLRNEFAAFSKDPSAKPVLSDSEVPQDDDGRSDAVIFLAKYRDEYLASAIVIFWQGIAFYHQGASVQQYPKIPASYLLQWEAIKEAKNRGCKVYNFWGIADVESERELEKHPWKGLSLFKKGFGGWAKAYVKTQDLPLSKRYLLTYIFERLRKIKRGF